MKVDMTAGTERTLVGSKINITGLKPVVGSCRAWLPQIPLYLPGLLHFSVSSSLPVFS